MAPWPVYRRLRDRLELFQAVLCWKKEGEEDY